MPEVHISGRRTRQAVRGIPPCGVSPTLPAGMRAAVAARAVIAELRWITPSDVAAMALAPLSLDHLLAIAWP